MQSIFDPSEAAWSTELNRLRLDIIGHFAPQSDERSPNKGELNKSDPDKRTLSEQALDERALVEQAMWHAAHLHAGQWRKSGEPAIIHPLRVAQLTTKAGLGAEAVVIALLHDVIEDSPLTHKDLHRQYGSAVADAVEGLTKAREAKRRGERWSALGTYRKLLQAAVRDQRPLVVKLFDRLDNMRDLSPLSRRRQRAIAEETQYVYAPLAKRVGLLDIADELHTLAFRYRFSRRFRRHQDALRALRQKEAPATESLQNLLSQALQKGGLQSVTLAPQYRSLAELHEHVLPPSSALKGFVVRVARRHQAYRALGIFHGRYRVVPHSMVDYISNPKPNAYRALETRLLIGGRKVHLSILTAAMHATNRQGILAGWHQDKRHLDEQHQGQPTFERYYRSYLELLSQDESVLRMDEVLQHAQLDSLQVYTPTGEVFEFPAASTILDFAFAIHSDLGLRCSGAQMDELRVSSFQTLANGATVRVFNDVRVQPDITWLNHTHTPKARLGIRRHLRSLQPPAAVTTTAVTTTAVTTTANPETERSSEHALDRAPERSAEYLIDPWRVTLWAGEPLTTPLHEITRTMHTLAIPIHALRTRLVPVSHPLSDARTRIDIVLGPVSQETYRQAMSALQQIEGIVRLSSQTFAP